ncbi:hypothetical protein FACS189430_04500 [Bacteroidia bacterium]|nr:hypothetical protein FACS189430_04500 [Bacteroidia bacterium]
MRFGFFGGNGSGIGGGGSSASGTIIIRSGTVSATGAGAGAGIGGTVTINGGSVKATNGTQTQPKNSDGDIVYLTTLTVGDSTTVNSTAIDAAKISTTPYGVNGVKTDASGKLYFYLPQNNSTSVDIAVGGTQYTNSAVNVTDNSSTGTLAANGTATWYSATYVADDKAGGYILATAQYFAGTQVRVLGNTGGLARNGYFFGGWTGNNGIGAKQPGETFTMPAAAVTLTATKAAVTNTGGTATVNYTGTTLDLTTVNGLFTVDANAGARTYTLEMGGTGAGSIDTDNKTLIITTGGTFNIGLATEASGIYAAHAKVTATLTVNWFPSATTIDMANTSPTDGTGWTYANNVYTIANGANVTVINSNAGSQRRLTVAADATATITLSGVTITASPPLLLNAGADVTLNLAADTTNTLTGGYNSAGIYVTSGATLTIEGPGILNATGKDNGAGIGGGGAGSNVTINGGAVTATGGTNGAGIGGGSGTQGGNITINGGTVTASKIGAGSGANTFFLTITGGSIQTPSPPSATNGDGKPVYRNTLTVGNPAVAGATAITAGHIAGIACAETPNAADGVYGIKDVQTDGDGKVYFYLPQSDGNEVVRLTASGTEYGDRYARATSAQNRTLTTGYLAVKTPVTYTAAEVGGTSGTVSSTGITLTFSEDVSSGLLAAGNITLTPAGAAVKGTLSGSGTTYTLNLTSVTTAGNVKVGIADFDAFVVENGNRTVSLFKDGVKPTVADVTPSGTGIPLPTTLSVTFDEEMNTTQGTVTLTPNAGLTLTFSSWSNGNTTANYTLSGLAYGATYTYAISNFKDKAGNVMETVTSGLTFTTVNKTPVINSGGSAEVTYDGSTIDLTTVSGLFTVDANAGARTYTIEASGTGAGSINTTDKKTLTVTAAGTFTIGLETEATNTHAASTAKVTATLTVNKANQATFAFATTAPSATYVSGFTYSQAPTGGIGAGDTTYDIIGGSGTASIDASTGQIYNATKAGTIQVRATKAANDLYNQATANYTLTVSKANQTTFAFATTDPSETYVLGFTYTQAPIGGIGAGDITYAIVAGGSGTASIDASTGQIYNATKAGTIQVRATKATNDLYNAATANYTLTVNKAAVTNTGGTATVNYTGSTLDLTTVNGLFTVGTGAGTRTYTLESGGTGAGSIGTDNRTLTITTAGTFVIGLETAATNTYAASTAKVTATLTVNKAAGAAVSGAPAVSGTPTLNSITVIAVTNAGGTGQAVEYAISEDGSATPTNGWQSVTTFTGLTPSTTYYVYARTAESANYNAGVAQVSAGIETAQPTYTLTVTAPTFTAEKQGYTQPAAEAITITSNGNSDATIADVSVDNTNFTIGGNSGNGVTVTAGNSISTLTVQPASGLGVGTHTATITVTYNGGATATSPVSFTVDKADLTGSVTISGNAVFGETLTANTGSLTTTPTGVAQGTLTYEWKRDGTTVGTNSATYTLVGDDIGSNITVTVTAANCASSVTSGAIGAVGKATLTTATVSLAGWTYDKAAKTPSVAGNTGSGTETYYYDAASTGAFSSTTQPTNAGTYYIRAEIAGTANYNAFTTPEVPFTIAPADITVSIAAYDKVYDGTTAATLSDTILTGKLAADDLYLTVGTITFADKDVNTNKTVTFSGYTLGGTDATNYSLAGSNSATATANITPAPLTVTPHAGQSKFDGDPDPAYTYDTDGWKGSDGASLLSGALARATGDNVGAYAITQGTLDAGANYTIDFTAGITFAITPATSNNTNVSAVAVSDATPQATNFYLADCGATQVQITITPQESTSQVLYNGTPVSTFSIDVTRADIHEVTYTVRSTDGSEQTHTLQIESRFAFADLVGTMFNNVIYVNNNPDNNGGYTFAAYQWYRNGQSIGIDQQYYSAGPARTDQLDPAADYSVAVTTKSINGIAIEKTLHVCPAKVILKPASALRAYPNPVTQGAQLTIESSAPDGSAIRIYNITGGLVGTKQLQSSEAQITAPQSAGVYLITVDGESVKIRVE